MAEVGGFGAGLVDIYLSFLESLSPFSRSFVNLFLLVLVVFIYAILIYKIYTLLATKNLFKINLNKYNTSEHPFRVKFFTGLLYFIEYLILVPIVIFLGFSVFAFFLMLFAENLEANTILIVSAVAVTIIRMTSYYKKELSKELAKLLPFTLLAVPLLTTPNLSKMTQKMLENLSQLPELFSNIIHYLIFIVIIEGLLRFFDFIFSLFGLEEE